MVGQTSRKDRAPVVLLRRQFVLTLALMPITFGVWYAADSLFAGPAVWLCDLLLSFFYPDIVQAAGLQGATMLLTTQFGETNGLILSAQEAGNQIALEINTRLVSYSIAFYAALLAASNLPGQHHEVLHRAVSGSAASCASGSRVLSVKIYY